MLKDFKKFVLRGNVVDLAIAVIIGAAFGAVITALTSDLLTPLVAAIFGKPDFSSLTFTVNGSKFNYGNFINAVISFLILAVALFFLVIQPINKLNERAKRRKTPEEPTDRACPECLSAIPKAAKRCSFCTANVKPLSQ
jgi:large conductance mechanosensitive channel